MKPLIIAAACGLLAAGAQADDSSLAALALADDAVVETPAPKSWRLQIDGAAGYQEGDDGQSRYWRGAEQFSLESSLTDSVRLVFRDRLDHVDTAGLQGHHTLNSWQEGYLNWQPVEGLAMDAGRINIRNGVATGYSPTDWFREGATRVVTDIDPTSLRQNRQGSVMLNGQWLWDSGAVSLLWSPRLSQETSTASFSADLGSTNAQQRGQLSYSPQINDRLKPQFLALFSEDDAPQTGVNLSLLLNDNTTLYTEWAGGRQQDQWDKAWLRDSADHFRSQLTVGGTFTSASKISLTAEYQYNEAAPDRDDWEKLRTLSPLMQAAYSGYLARSQEIATRAGIFFFFNWQDSLVDKLEVNAMLRLDQVNDSQLYWGEFRYHFTRWDAALQWQHYSPGNDTLYGAAPFDTQLNVLLTLYL